MVLWPVYVVETKGRRGKRTNPREAGGAPGETPNGFEIVFVLDNPWPILFFRFFNQNCRDFLIKIRVALRLELS